MAEYYLTSEAFLVERRRLIKRFILFAVALPVFGFCYSYWVLRADLEMAMLFILPMVGIVAFSYYRSLQQQRQLLDSYRLLVESDSISRFLTNMPTIQLTPADIKSITEYAPGTLAITTADKYQTIYVRVHISDRPELLRELERFAPLTPAPPTTWLQKLVPLVSLAVLLAMGVFYLTNDKIVSTLSGSFTLGILAWSSWHIWHNKNLPSQTRRVLWFMPLIFFSILAGIISRLLS